jgi:hypothetical protein
MKAWMPLAAAGVLVSSLVSLTPISADASAAAPNRYRHYAACGVSPDEEPSHSCPKRGKKGAFFKSLDAAVTYRVCVKFPNHRKLCASHQQAGQGELKINTITSHMVGRHVVTWYVGGTQIGAYSFRIHA